MKRIFAFLTALSLILSMSCLSASALEAGSGENGQRPDISTQGSGQALQSLVENGLISQTTLDNILRYLEEHLSEAPSGSPQGEPPERPDGAPQGEPPEKPDGEAGFPGAPGGNGNGEAPSMPVNGQWVPLSQELLEALVEAGILTQDEMDAILAFFQSSNMGAAFGANPPSGAPGSSERDISYAGATEIRSEETISDGVFLSDSWDENAILIDTDEAVTLSNPTVTKSGDSDGGDSCNFYGLNAAVLAKGGADVAITGGSITSDAEGANGVFSYGGNGGQNGAAGDGTTVTITDTVITTTGDSSGGIMTTGGGITIAKNVTVTTSGRSSAAIRTDRGGGTVTVTGGAYTTNGLGSPAIYSTAAIAVESASLTSNLSEGVCIEGKNSITLTDCDLIASNTECNGNATFLDSVMIYQSMSGDADSGTSAFTMTGGSLTSRSGHVFHVTNTHAVITLCGVQITNEDTGNVLLSVCSDGWSGAENRAELYANAQELAGSILVGSDAGLTISLSGGSSFTGCISGSIANSRGETVSTEVGRVSVSLDESSTWTLTADTYISDFTGNAAQVIGNGHTLYVDGAALEGTR